MSNIFSIGPIIDQLINLPYNDLISLCRTDKYLNDLCNGDYLWNLRTENEFIGYNVNVDFKPSDYVKVFGLPVGMNIKQYYKYLHDISRPINIYIY